MKLRLLLSFILFVPAAASADSSALILSGVPGSPEHAEKFTKWAEGTQKVLVEKFGFSPDRVILLSDKKTTQDDVRAAFATLKRQLKATDSFFLFFIGHGSGEGEYKFNISGPDFTAADYNKLLSTLTVGRTVIVNGTSASGGAIEQFAGKNRVVVTATRSGQEGNDTVFYEYFLEALQTKRPKAAGIFTALGVLALSGGDREAARRDFAAALAIEPASPEAMGRLFQMCGHGVVSDMVLTGRVMDAAEALSHGIGDPYDNWNARRRILGSSCSQRSDCDDDIDLQSYEFVRQAREFVCWT